MVPPHNRIPLSHRKELLAHVTTGWVSKTSRSLKQARQKEYLVRFYLCEISEQGKLIHKDRKQIGACLGVRVGCEGMIEMFYILIRVMVTQLNKYIETHLTLHLKWILLHIGKLYLNKTWFKESSRKEKTFTIFTKQNRMVISYVTVGSFPESVSWFGKWR